MLLPNPALLLAGTLGRRRCQTRRCQSRCVETRDQRGWGCSRHRSGRAWVGGWRGSSRRDAPPPRVRVWLTPRQRTLVGPSLQISCAITAWAMSAGCGCVGTRGIQVLAFEVSIGRQPLIRSDRSHRGNGVTHQLQLGSASVPASGYRRTRSATGVTSAPRREPQRITSLSFLARLMFIADYPTMLAVPSASGGIPGRAVNLRGPRPRRPAGRWRLVVMSRRHQGEPPWGFRPGRGFADRCQQ